MTDLPEYRYERVFKAPRDLVWTVWTDPKHLAEWYGPGVETTIHRFDLRPGGEWHNEMAWGEHRDLSKMVFQDVVVGERLVWHHSSADSDWNVAPNAMVPNWPLTLLTTVTFTDVSAGTKVTLTQVPLGASAEECEAFATMMSGMDKGWGSGFGIIEEMLARLQA